MTEGGKVNCPECGWLVTALGFCDSCGADLEEAGNSQAAGEQAAAEQPPGATDTAAAQPGESLPEEDTGSCSGSEGGDAHTPPASSSDVAAPGVAGTGVGKPATPVDVDGEPETPGSLQTAADEVSVSDTHIPLRTPPEAGSVKTGFRGGSVGGSSSAYGHRLLPCDSECEDLAFFSDDSRIFVEGATFPLRVRACSRDEDLTDVEIVARTIDLGNDRELRSTKKLRRLRPDRERVVSVDFKPPSGMYGLKTFQWLIAYTKDRTRYQFESDDVEYEIHRRDEDPQQVIRKGIYNIEISGHANDVSADFYKDMLGKQKLSIEGLIQNSRRAPAAWRELPLNEDLVVDPAAGHWPSPPQEALVEQLTLRYGDQLIHVLAPGVLALGRDVGRGKRCCDIMTRTSEQLTSPRRADHAIRVSRLQCQLSLDGSSCQIQDGVSKPSARGTFVDGKCLHYGSPFELAPGHLYTLSLGGERCDDKGVFCARLEPLLCRARGTTECTGAENCVEHPLVGLTLHRADSIPESYAVIRGCVPLREANKSLAQLWVRRTQGAFAYRAGQERGWLVAGASLTLPNGDNVEVIPYSQWEL